MDIIVSPGNCIIFEKKQYLSGDKISGLPKNEVDRLISIGKAMPVADEDDGVIAKTKPPEEMTVPKLKELLAKLEVPYASDARKDDLVALVNEHTAEPPEA